MAQQFSEITDRLRRFIEAQQMFFVAYQQEKNLVSIDGFPTGLRPS